MRKADLKESRETKFKTQSRKKKDKKDEGKRRKTPTLQTDPAPTD